MFPASGVAGEGISLRGDPVPPGSDAPLAKGFIVFFGRHHGNILSYADFGPAKIGPDAVGLRAVEDEEVAGFH